MSLDSHTEAALRRVVREEFSKLLPELRGVPAYFTVRECARRFRIGYHTVRADVGSGRLATVKRGSGVGRKGTILIVSASAESLYGPGLP